MQQDGLVQIAGSAIVQQEQPLSRTHKRCRTKLITTGRPLGDPIRQTRSYVMDREIGIRCENLI